MLRDGDDLQFRGSVGGGDAGEAGPAAGAAAQGVSVPARVRDVITAHLSGGDAGARNGATPGPAADMAAATAETLRDENRMLQVRGVMRGVEWGGESFHFTGRTRGESAAGIQGMAECVVVCTSDDMRFAKFKCFCRSVAPVSSFAKDTLCQFQSRYSDLEA